MKYCMGLISKIIWICFRGNIVYDKTESVSCLYCINIRRCKINSVDKMIDKRLLIKINRDIFIYLGVKWEFNFQKVKNITM